MIDFGAENDDGDGRSDNRQVDAHFLQHLIEWKRVKCEQAGKEWSVGQRQWKTKEKSHLFPFD